MTLGADEDFEQRGIDGHASLLCDHPNYIKRDLLYSFRPICGTIDPMVLQLLFSASLAAAGATPSVLAGPAAQAQPAGQAPAHDAQLRRARPPAEAYYQFLLGRHLESEGDVEGAVRALREAARLDPASAEVLAELATLYARQDKFQEALDAAELALKNAAANASAHRVLGILYASLARPDEGSGNFSGEAAGFAAKAADHLEAARKAGAREPGLDLMLGRILLRTGEVDRAIGVLVPVVVDEPWRPDGVTLLVQAYQRANRVDDAIRLLEGRTAEQPQFYSTLGELYERQKRWADAAKAYERAAARAPKNVELRTRQAAAMLSSGDAAQAGKAVELLQQARHEAPGDTRLLYVLSQALRTVGKLDEAESTARELIAAAPGSLTGPYSLALALEARQQYRQLAETLEPIVARTPAAEAGRPEFVPLLVHLGFAYVELGRSDQALAVFERARAASPLNSAIDLYILQAQVSARRDADAIALAGKLRVTRPGDQRVVRLEAEALRHSGKVEEGLAALTRALDEHPDDVAGYVALAEYQAAVKDFEGARRVLDGAATKFPSDLTVPFQIGSMFEREKRFADAEKKFREVLAKDPLHAPALNYLGYMLAERGERLDESIGYIQRALQVEPNNGAYLDSLGWAYFRQNKLDLAEATLRRAADQRPRDSAVQDHFGDLLFKLGRFQDAVAAWERARTGTGEEVDLNAVDAKIRTAREKARKQ
jgi:tetratricopeptide (TPR) repeat protein